MIFFNFLANQIANAGTQEVPYSEFIEMVEQDKVATAELTANQITFYLKEDLPAGVEGSTAEPSQDLAQVLTQQDGAGRGHPLRHRPGGHRGGGHRPHPPAEGA